MTLAVDVNRCRRSGRNLSLVLHLLTAVIHSRRCLDRSSSPSVLTENRRRRTRRHRRCGAALIHGECPCRCLRAVSFIWAPRRLPRGEDRHRCAVRRPGGLATRGLYPSGLPSMSFVTRLARVTVVDRQRPRSPFSIRERRSSIRQPRSNCSPPRSRRWSCTRSQLPRCSSHRRGTTSVDTVWADLTAIGVEIDSTTHRPVAARPPPRRNRLQDARLLRPRQRRCEPYRVWPRSTNDSVGTPTPR